jgi:UDP-glucose 4-epimerase
VVSIFVERLLAGMDCTIYGDGEQTRDYVYVGDVVQANIAALADPIRGTYNIGTATETSVNEMYRQLEVVMELKRPARYAPPRPGEQQRSAVDIRKAEREMNWRPRVGIRDGLAYTVEYFRSRTGPRPT